MTAAAMWKTIVSAYTGKCATCGARIPKGSLVEWKPGGGVRHVGGTCKP